MAGMAEVAKATVTIVPNMQGAQQSITSQFGDIMGSAGDSASGLAGSSFLSGFAAKMGGLKGIMAKVLPAASVAAAGKALYEIGETFDEMTDSIIVGTGATGETLESLKQSAMDMATTVPMSFGEAGNIVQDLNTRLGLTGDTLTAVGTQIAQVGDMTGEAFDTEAFAGAMSAWGTSAEEMSGQLDTLFAVSQSTGIGMNELTSIVESAAPQMQTLGYSFEETAAMAGMLDKAGLDANGTMSKMSKALTTLAKDGEEPGEAFKRVTEEIGNYIEQGDEAAAINAATDLFGTRGATQFVAAVQSGSMSLEDFTAQVSNSGGIIGETQQRTMDFSERVQLLKNRFMELLEPMGSAVFSGLSTAMELLSDAFSRFVDGPGQKIGEVFRDIVDFGGELASSFMEAFSSTSAAESFGGALTSVGAAAKTLFSAIRPLFTVLKSLLSAVVPPLARVVGAVLGAAFRTVSAAVRAASTVFNSIKSTINTVKSAFRTFKNVVTAPFRFLGGLKRPHINISGGSVPFGIGGKGTKPSISVTWGAKGGILDGATLIGAGEAGKEALLPLDRNTQWMDDLADRIGGAGNTFNINMTVDGAENPEQYAQRFVRELRRQVRMGAI